MMTLVHKKPPLRMPVASSGSLAAITCHFNFADFNRPRQNLARFARQMFAAGVPLYGVELYRPGQQPYTDGWPNWTQIRANSRSIMFQKEALLNIAAGRLPAHVRFVAWIDGDVAFSNAAWPSQTVEVLERFPVAQLFSQGHLTGQDGRVLRSWSSCGAEQTIDMTRAHTGLAWAARRELWDNGGLYPYSITGAGDVIMASSFLNVPLSPDYVQSLGVNGGGPRFKIWDAMIRKWGDGALGYVGGDCFHEWHGSPSDRKYLERKAVLGVFDVERDVLINPEGVLQFKDGAPPALVEYLAQMFKARREDG